MRDTETITRVDGAVRSALLVKASHSINRSGVASARPLRLDSGYSSALTLFYYFHFIILIRVRLASALFACAQPPRPAHRARPMAAALTTRARSRARSERLRHRDNAHCFKRFSFCFSPHSTVHTQLHSVSSAVPTVYTSHRAIISMSPRIRISRYWLRFHPGMR